MVVNVLGMVVGSVDGLTLGLVDALIVGTLELGETVPTYDGLLDCFEVGTLVVAILGFKKDAGIVGCSLEIVGLVV